MYNTSQRGIRSEKSETYPPWEQCYEYLSKFSLLGINVKPDINVQKSKWSVWFEINSFGEKTRMILTNLAWLDREKYPYMDKPEVIYVLSKYENFNFQHKAVECKFVNQN